ncbi:hypothetical protein [Streptomyces sp. NPDC001205]
MVALTGTGSRTSSGPADAGLRHTIAAVDAHVHDQCGEFIGELLVWTDKGATLTAPEYAWITDRMPSSLPPADQVQLTVR